jgi:multidrug transporter EmrE-like cation transporter
MKYMSTWESNKDSDKKSNKKSKKKIGIFFLIFMQLSVVVYTMSGICGKLASKYPTLSFEFIGMYALDVFILGIYAILWQQIIKRIDLSIAYCNKGTSLLWSLVWSIVFFHEKLTVSNAIGIVVVMIGIMIVNMDGTSDNKKNNKEEADA